MDSSCNAKLGQYQQLYGSPSHGGSPDGGHAPIAAIRGAANTAPMGNWKDGRCQRELYGHGPVHSVAKSAMQTL